MRADGVPQAARPLGGLDADMAWYRTHKQALEGRYSGQHLVIMDQRVVDHAAEFGALAERALGRFGSGPILMPRCVLGERVVRVRSPRVEPA